MSKVISHVHISLRMYRNVLIHKLYHFNEHILLRYYKKLQ